jgi:hypothetical protein
MHLLFLLVAACGTTENETDTGVPDTDTGSSSDSETDSSDTTLPDTDTGLYGTFPAEALSLPEFTATNYDGAARTREDVLGSPTVMWFFPAAGTYG